MNDPTANVSTTEQLLENNRRYAASFDDASLAGSPAQQVAVVACMDARLDPYSALGLRNGDAHLLRNGGGVITDDVIRSLCLSQRYLGTREIILLHHTDCGLSKITQDELNAELLAETGQTPTWDLQAFTDVDDDVRVSMQRLAASPFLPHRDRIRGFVYDVSNGTLREVVDAAPAE